MLWSSSRRAFTKRGSNRKYWALEDALPAELRPPSGSRGDALPRPLVMHRLDVPVAGLCVVAKTRAAAREIGRQFQEREVQKTYQALLVGVPDGVQPEPAHEPSVGPRSCHIIDEPVGGLPAVTELELLSITPHVPWGALSTVRLRPKTGRTHQLRVHCATALGCPIIGDDLYWSSAEEARRSGRGDGGQELPALQPVGCCCGHAVHFTHPTDGSSVIVMVPEMRKFEALRERGRRGAAFEAAQGAAAGAAGGSR